MKIKKILPVILAILMFIAEITLMARPGGWIREDVSNFLSGEGSRALTTEEGAGGFCQEFEPQYGQLQKISLLFHIITEGELQGNVKLVLSDAADNVYYQEQVSYEEMNFDSYMDFEMNISLDAGEKYYLSVLLNHMDGAEIMPAACGTEYYMAENTVLTGEVEIANMQFVSGYHYTDALPLNKLMKAVFLCLITSIGVAIGIPDKKYLRQIAGVLLFIAAPILLGRRLELLVWDPQFRLPFAMNWNVGIMYGLQIVILLLTCSFRWSVIIANGVLTVLYSLNYFVLAFRGKPVRINDITAIGTAAEVAGNYDYTPNSHMAFAWGIALFFIVWAARCAPKDKFFKTVKQKIVGRAVFGAVAVAILWGGGYQLLYTEMLQNNGFKEFYGFDHNMSIYFNGFLVDSCIDIQNSRMEEPTGYSHEQVEMYLQQYLHEENTSEELPHVIMIMNESFSDLRVLGNLELSEENMEFFYGLDENVIRGTVNASVLGGGTANSEFEVFTGCSMGLLPSEYYAYQQCVTGSTQSLISTMEEAGYKTISMHPELSNNWNRKVVYQYLGFDKCLWKDDFQGGEVVHSGISDLDTYLKIEELFENRTEGEKLFIFDLTMQNHGGYEESNVEQTVKGVNVSSAEADTYLSLIKQSDEAFEQLIRYFEGVEEKVVVCMFGDHLPKFGDESFYENLAVQTPEMDELTRTLNEYKTPFVIWSNYEMEEQEGLDISMNYLGVLLLKTVGIQDSAYFDYLYQLMQEYPIITVNGYQDAEGNFYNWSGNKDEFPEYRMMLYNLLFDRNSVEWGY